MKVAFIVNDFDYINLDKDTSIYLIHEGLNLKHEVEVLNISDVSFKDNEVFGLCKKIAFPDKDSLNFSLGKPENRNLRNFDFVVNRVTPPFNKEYLYLTLLLELKNIKCINSTKSLRENNEKLSILNFQNLIPKTLVTNSFDNIRNFLINECEKIVLKPLDGMGGKSIFVINKGDKNLNVIWENITDNGRKHVMAQEYVKDSDLGDNRLVYINYQLLSKKVVRIPSDEDFRGNLAVGAKSIVKDVTEFDEEVSKQIIPYLKDNSIYFAGVDFLGRKLSEINLTSPTCLQEIHRGTSLNPGKIFWENLE